MRAAPFTRIVGLALATMLCSSGAFAAEGIASTADGVLKLSNTTPKVGEALTVSFTTTAIHNKIRPCQVQLIVGSPDSSISFLKMGPSLPSMLNTSPPLVLPFTLTKPGKYRVMAINPGTPGTCGDLSSGTIVSSNLQIDFTLAAPVTLTNLPVGTISAANPGLMVSTPGTCPTGYDRLTSGVDTSKGEFYCMKKWQDCPAGYTQSVDNNTGVITCTPTAAPACPAGWKGGVVEGGKLVCHPIPQPVIACGDSPMKLQGFYLQYGKYQNPDWNRMGCTAMQQVK